MAFGGVPRSSGAANVGWRLMLLTAAMYFLILALTDVFDCMVLNLPGN